MRSDYSPFFRSTVGFDRLLNLLDTASEQGYPPYNIERSDENNYRVTVAVAGFAEKDLSVDVKDRVLTVTGKKDEVEKPAYLHQGIAGRGRWARLVAWAVVLALLLQGTIAWLIAAFGDTQISMTPLTH